MNRIRFGFYPHGKRKALTMSYDDGKDFDRRLVEIFNKYGIRGTFHLNSSSIGKNGFISEDDVKVTFAGHEVSCHSLTHPYLDRISSEEVIQEIMVDRTNLERLCGYPVRGMSYPSGSYSADLITQLRFLGMSYSRTVKATNSFNIPEDFMQWHPTCHHKGDIISKLESFKKDNRPLSLFYVWGHSYEFPKDNNWDLIEDFCNKASGDDSIWYATNIEIYDYITALRALRFSADRQLVFNPSAADVWIDVDGVPVEIKSGIVTCL